MATMTFAESNPALEGAPGSPPDLTNSKSSKSSSFHSETLSDIMGPADLSHFEDINLDDVQGAHSPVLPPFALPLSNKAPYAGPRTSFSSVTSSRSTPHPPLHSFRDLTANAKPRYPSVKGQVNGAVRPPQQQQQPGLSAPTRSSMRRGLTSPSAPSLTSNMSRNGRRSRSPSPAHPHSPVFSSAPRSLSRRSSRNLDVASVSSQNPRRQSWQHGNRKSVKELEAECDDDGDDELPEDAVIWNVPMSPRPPQDRSPTLSATQSPPIGSTSPSVSRRSSQQSQVSTASGSRLSSASQSPNPASRDRSQPVSGQLSRQRTNTWEETYTTLDPDAKMLTEALEQYQQDFEQQQEVQRQSKASPTLSQQPTPRAKTQSLPPLRRSDPLVDPFQPSKEKEKYLSRTRPSWLPPKDPKEEKKHLKELQQIEARRIAAGKEPRHPIPKSS
jgi:TBC1 domain family member 14